MKSGVRIIQTVKSTKEGFCEKEKGVFTEIKSNSNIVIEIHEEKCFQTIEGFGGAFTEAAADTFYKMSKEKRTEIIKAYFSKEGLNYNFCRTHINSCDFSLGNYAYDEVEGDLELKNFSIERDRQQLIPFIKEAKAVEGADFKLFASPWSPPAWMKTNGEMNNGGKLKEEYRDAWALYYAKYIKEYEKEGLEIWGVSVQNEPMAKQVWDSCIYTAEEERDFVRDYLGPTLEREGLGDKNIIIWDHNRDLLYKRAKVALEDKECAKYVWGVGFHWYAVDQFENLDKVHNEFPDKKLLFTEGCQEGGVRLGSWEVGERYGHNMIGDLNNHTVGWVDWNMVLNEEGGPNHVGNLCDAPIIADTQKDIINYQSSYYYIGHFSKYIKLGAIRIGFTVSSNSPLEMVAFKNPDGEIVVILMNNTEDSIKFALKIEGKAVEIKSEARSIMTLLCE